MVATAPRVRELVKLAEVVAATGDDPLLVWAAQGLASGVRAFTRGDAVAVAAPGLSGHDRLAVCGGLDDTAVLVRRVLAEVGSTYRPIGDDSLVTALVGTLDELAIVDGFGWMDTVRTTRWPSEAAWLSEAELVEVDRLLRTGFPNSCAWPGRSGVRRWAGVRDEEGRLVAAAADAWSAPRAGFLAGVVTHPAARGRGYSAAVCAFVRDALIDRYGRVGLMVDSWNTTAIRLYQRLGFHLRPVAAASVRPV
jgi:RimJ/RimL family protein N-acetyltransferase